MEDGHASRGGRTWDGAMHAKPVVGAWIEKRRAALWMDGEKEEQLHFLVRLQDADN